MAIPGMVLPRLVPYNEKEYILKGGLISQPEKNRGNYIAAAVLLLIVPLVAYHLGGLLFHEKTPAGNLRPPGPDQKTSGKNVPGTKYQDCQTFEITSHIDHNDDCSVPSLIKAVEQSLIYLKRKNRNGTVRFGRLKLPISDVIRMTADFRDAITKWGLGEKFTSWLNENYVFLKVRTNSVTITGYYLPLLKGSEKKTDEYKYPLYQKPDDLVKVDLKKFNLYKEFTLPPSIKGRLTTDNDVIPYYTRAEIDFNGALSSKNDEIVWIDNIVDIHNLHVQGSGVVEFPDGNTQRFGYGGSNGHRFKGITTPLKKKGILPPGVNTPVEVNQYLKNHPELWEETFSVNPRYLFFRKLKGHVVGSLGIEVTGHRTIACDQRVFPSGAIALIETSVPVVSKEGKRTSWKNIRRFVLNQDSGNAIKGKSHIDLFCGFGDRNRTIAASMRQKGQMWFLVKKSVLKKHDL